MSNYKNILIVRTDRIGDVVLTLPLAKVIKEKYPYAKVTFLVRDYTTIIPRLNKFVDNVLTLPVKNDTLNFSELFSEIRSGKFDTAIIVYPKFIISLVLFLAKIDLRIGSGYRWFSFLFNKRIYEHRKTGDKHELEYNLNLLQPLGIEKINKSSVSFDIQPSNKSEQKIQSLLAKKGLKKDKRTIIIHPGSGGSSIDLPISKFIRLTRKLAQELDCNLVITGSKDEKEICQKFMISENTYNFAGELNLEELIAVISVSDLLIANSTGPIHIAAALNKNVVGFYPKINECSVERWGPYTNKRFIFSPTIDCTNCTREQCKRLDCMNSIEVESVFTAIQKIMS